MRNYINKEIAIERIKRVKPYFVMSEYGVGYERGLKDAIGILNATPAVDVQPVKRGRWIDIYEWAKMHDSIPSGMCTYYWCSECQEEQEKKSNFCPACGADMREPTK